MNKQLTDPLHGKTLEMIVTHLVEMYGWEELGNRIRINCFKDNPGIKSRLTFYAKRRGQERSGRALY
jgi:uncharacterized protein (DUF2132 family)